MFQFFILCLKLRLISEVCKNDIRENKITFETHINLHYFYFNIFHDMGDATL